MCLCVCLCLCLSLCLSVSLSLSLSSMLLPSIFMVASTTGIPHARWLRCRQPGVQDAEILLLRPLLQTEKSRLVAYCLARGVPVWALPRRLSTLSVFYSKSTLYGALLWARGALNGPFRRLPARTAVGAGSNKPRRESLLPQSAACSRDAKSHPCVLPSARASRSSRSSRSRTRRRGNGRAFPARTRWLPLASPPSGRRPTAFRSGGELRPVAAR